MPEHPTLPDLLDAPERALELTQVEAVSALARVGALEAVLRVRLAVGDAGRDGKQPATPEGEMLTAAQAAQRTGMSTRWLYMRARAGTLPFARRVSARSVRFSAGGIEKWLAAKTAAGGARAI